MVNIKDCQHEEYEYADGMLATADAPYDGSDFWWTVDCKQCGLEIAQGDFYDIPEWVKKLTDEGEK